MTFRGPRPAAELSEQFIEVNAIIGPIYFDKMHVQRIHEHFIEVIPTTDRIYLDKLHFLKISRISEIFKND